MAEKRTDISTREGLVFGALMLGQVSGILIAATLIGFVIDQALDSAPLGLATAALVGGLLATVTVLTKVAKKLKE